MSVPHEEQVQDELLVVDQLQKHFPITNALGKTINNVRAVDSVSFTLKRKQTLGIVGESGCGKSTTGRTLLRLIEPTGGKAVYKGQDLFSLEGKELMKMRREMQMIFQDPHSSINPKQRVGNAVEEPMVIHRLYSGKDRMTRAMDLLAKVGLREDQYFRFPHEFSGGQRQRIGIARALAVNPEIIVCDEPVSALDVSIQSQVINLMQDIQDEFDLAYIFIAHDLSVVRHIADEVGVMYLGNLVEKAETDELYKHPLHPYTQALLSSIPSSSPSIIKERITLKGDLPSPIDPPNGCKFHTRCPHVMNVCKEIAPEFKHVSSEHGVACHLY
ncbi:oligopeptide transport ATP-binding protein OppF [Geomicrobium sp. JCM 19037]|uniref:ABC transporter ATP-binding protein n=1 Tax=Geomicrobium sp. JCM 19037 TaxID=1460634 RepID=UPI00045F2E6F|nr:dipeptide ABC transporter ATP-binding protein [Geomicrobium sp. JCM 19037]GAK04928.1 oligopeptide transport ATP-binding protein OppF [Geomicrobium sp. JCM 19037]